MACSKCENESITYQTSVINKSKSRSFLWNLLMICLTGGLWILWMLIRKRKEKQIKITTATCQTCGYSWEVK